MYKKFLLSIFAMIVGLVTASAQTSVIIDVDKADNVNAYSASGTITLSDGVNRITTLTSADNPLTIEAANGATIVSVTKNGTDSATPSGDGKYRFSIESMMISIVTSGGSGSTTEPTEVGFTLASMGLPNSFTAKVGDKDVTLGTEMKVEAGAEVTVYPVKGYAIDKVMDLFNSPVGSANADGTYTFNVGNDTSNWYYVYTSITGLSFTIDPDYAPNVLVMLNAKPDESDDAYSYVQLNLSGTTQVVTSEEMQPILFMGDNDAEVVSVTRNGEPVQYREQGVAWVSGYASAFADGDLFVVTTKGKDVEFTIKAADNNAPLESYFFKLADGTVLNLSGTEQTVTLPLGSKIYIEGRPGTNYRYVISSSTTSSSTSNDMQEWVRVLADCTATVYGTRQTGVTVDVDDASRVSVVQSNGRGDALVLSNGENKFELANILNSLAITPTEGNQIVSVALNGDEVEANRTGVYLVTVEEGSYVSVVSRKIPGDVPVTFVLNEGADISWLSATVDGEPIELSSTTTVKSGTDIVLSPVMGYRIDAVSTATPGCNVVADQANGTYTITVGDQADAAMFSVIVNEITAAEGNALVIIKTESSFFTFLNRQPDGTSEGRLSLDQVNEVKIGNSVYMSTFTSGVYIKSLTVNGTAYPDAVDKRYYSVTITENSTIELVAYQRVEAATINSIDPVSHITSGMVYLLDANGNKVTSMECEVGQTVTLTAEATVGYKLTGINKIYPDPSGPVTDNSYTITELDAEYGMVQFQGVFEADTENPSYTVRTKGAYETIDGIPYEQIGYIYIYLGQEEPTEINSDCVTEYTALEGDKLRLICLCRDDYHIVSFCLSEGYPNSTFPGSYYTVNGDDADADGVIWITGLLEKNSSGIDDINAEAAVPVYDRASATLTTATETRIFAASGAAVMTVEAGSTSLSTLPAGVYIAVTADGKTLKFVK